MDGQGQKDIEIAIIVEESADGYVAYLPGQEGKIVGRGDTYRDALKDFASAVSFETFGADVLIVAAEEEGQEVGGTLTLHWPTEAEIEAEMRLRLEGVLETGLIGNEAAFVAWVVNTPATHWQVLRTVWAEAGLPADDLPERLLGQ